MSTEQHLATQPPPQPAAEESGKHRIETLLPLGKRVLINHILHLEEEIATLRPSPAATAGVSDGEDTQRLDWIEKNFGQWHQGYVLNRMKDEWRLNSGFNSGATAREAIDAAMTAR